jgi:pyruvate, water dikinase
LFIVQTRPETVHSNNAHKDKTFVEHSFPDDARHQHVAARGIAVGDGIGVGKTRVVTSIEEVDTVGFSKGDVLVTSQTDPDWEPIMRMAAAIITDEGGRTCHAAIVAREMGLTAVVGCGNATSTITDGGTVTVSCAEGETGFVYDGAMEFTSQAFTIDHDIQTKVPIMLNIASPEAAARWNTLPCVGIGLAREEFIINNTIRAHPLALLRHETLGDPELSAEITKMTDGYGSGRDFFVEKLSSGVASIAASFYPRQVIVRLSDFKSNEYRGLLGGGHFEPREENPMIGWRGASRYYSEDYADAFAMECEALLHVRNDLGLSNITIMVPFCRTPDEMVRVTKVMAENGLVRGENGLKIYMMAEIPSNFIIAEQFCPHIDGFSIGSNDLTQLTLGLDRDSRLVSHLYDERSDAVKEMIRMVIQKAHEHGVKVGLCGQGPSDFPDFAEFLAEAGIDTISVTPDALPKVQKILGC